MWIHHKTLSAFVLIAPAPSLRSGDNLKHISAIIIEYLQRLGLSVTDRLATMPYAEYLRTPQWHAKRHAAIARANYKCQKCYTQDHLQVHHKTYERRGHEEPGDLMVLCDKCHKKVHRL